MKQEFALDENDYLALNLYIASISPSANKVKKRSRIIPAIFYLLIAVDAFRRHLYIAMSIFIVLAAAWYFIFPIWINKWRFKHFRKHIREQHKAHLYRPTVIQIDTSSIYTKDEGSESRTNVSDINAIYEIPRYIFIRLPQGLYLVLPKSKLTDLSATIVELKQLASELKIPYTVNLGWGGHY